MPDDLNFKNHLSKASIFARFLRFTFESSACYRQRQTLEAFPSKQVFAQYETITMYPYSIFSPWYDFVIEPFLAPFKEFSKEILLTKFNALSNIRILEVAGGTGSQSFLLSSSGFSVVAVEKAKGMLSQMHNKAKKSGAGEIFPIRADATDLPFPSSIFDAVIVQLALHEMDENIRLGCLSEIKRIAKRNAVFIIVDFMPALKFSLSSFLILLAEIAAGMKHFHNGREFLRQGGVRDVMRHSGFEIEESYNFFQSNLCLVVAYKQVTPFSN